MATSAQSEPAHQQIVYFECLHFWFWFARIPYSLIFSHFIFSYGHLESNNKREESILLLLYLFNKISNICKNSLIAWADQTQRHRTEPSIKSLRWYLTQVKKEIKPICFRSYIPHAEFPNATAKSPRHSVAGKNKKFARNLLQMKPSCLSTIPDVSYTVWLW